MDDTEIFGGAFIDHRSANFQKRAVRASRGLGLLLATNMAISAAGTGVASSAAPPMLAHIPLCPGLTIVTAIGQADGDYESIKTIESISDKNVALDCPGRR